MKMLDAIVDLRLASLRALGALGDEGMARKMLRAEWRTGLAAARNDGVIEVLPAPGGERLAAALLIRPHPMPIFKGKRIGVLLRGSSERSRAWMRERLAAHAHHFQGGASAQISRLDADLLADLERLGMHVIAIVLGGDPRRALRRLRRAYGALEWAGVECRPLQTRQVSAVTSIMREEFSRNPQFGSFVANKRFLSMYAADLREQIAHGEGTQWALVQGSRVLGHFGFHHEPRSSFGMSLAKMDLTFGRELQGRGLAKVAYRTVLERMVELDVGMLVGGTSQPPVMRHGQLMGRPLIGYELRADGAWFPREHFRYPTPRS